ncbi:gamma-glutamyltransferase family protein [Sedimentitalea sp. HM32M-2]|uniref:gamma-glutamyltransferase family protein n=1 Tax=Sedimentitalea sp. HM32M-2 TaxID=3351566 RepID=UPI0036372B70
MRDFQLPGRSAMFAGNGMCATSHPLAAQTAIDILRRGGNAMDAAIAGALLLGICEPQMTGLGGDCFVLFTRPGSQEIAALNGSGRAPQRTDPERLRRAGLCVIPRDSPEAVTIPGALDAFCHLSEAEGRIGLDAILAPTIHYAEAGVPVAPRVAYDWRHGASLLNARAQESYMFDGKPPVPGQMFRAPAQAEILRRVARDGRDAFYSGEIAEDIVATLNRLGGAHDLQDFAATAATSTQPLGGRYDGIDLIEHPPNGQGATAILMLNILSHFDLSGLPPLGAARIHIEAEAAKLAYDARNRFIADPDHSRRVDHMLAPQTAARLAKMIEPDRVLPAVAPLTEAVHKDTVLITVVDRDRMAVSLISSIFHRFGSGIASDRFGILLHNRGQGFTLEPGHPNMLGGGKRPMHTIIPAMLRENGRVSMAFGVMGGAYQPSGHARLITNLRDFGMELQAAVDAPRAFPDGELLQLERGYPDAVRRDLSALGHKVAMPEAPLGGAQAIRIGADGILQGASDPRKDGCALGY